LWDRCDLRATELVFELELALELDGAFLAPLLQTFLAGRGPLPLECDLCEWCLPTFLPADDDELLDPKMLTIQNLLSLSGILLVLT